jgi:protein involved in polysaccharide export with SLBB domain
MHSLRTRPLLTDRRPLLLVVCLAALANGCAAMTNPAADGVPVRLVPPELLTSCHEGEQPLPLNLLRQPQPADYRLAPGDVLSVWVDAGFLGDRNLPLPIYSAQPIPERDPHRQPPTIGYPVPVDADGTIALPGVSPLRVEGLTVPEAREAIRKLYRLGNKIQETDRVFASLLQPRHYQVMVVRQEGTAFTQGTLGVVNAAKRGTGQLIDLPAYENDVLHAMLRTGGLPGLDARNEVIVLRDGAPDRTVHIPLRVPCGMLVPLRPEDVVLGTGDVVVVPTRENEVFYAGGLLPPGEYVLPRDRDLDVLEAVTLIRGPLLNGAFGGSNLSGNLIQAGLGQPSPTQLTVLRRLPNGGQLPILVDLDLAFHDVRERIPVRPGDVLILQEKPGQALTRYVTQTFFNFDIFWQVFHSKFATGVIDVAAPDRLPSRVGVLNNFQPQQ